MSLHNKIMNIQANERCQNKAIASAMKEYRTYHEILVAVYQRGYRDARYAAAELLTEPDLAIEAYERDQCGRCDHVKLNASDR